MTGQRGVTERRDHKSARTTPWEMHAFACRFGESVGKPPIGPTHCAPYAFFSLRRVVRDPPACASWEGDVMKKLIARRLAIPAAAACLFGIVIVTPLMAPTANADQLPNGYNVTCTPMNGEGGVNCDVSGCPRVKGTRPATGTRQVQCPTHKTRSASRATTQSQSPRPFSIQPSTCPGFTLSVQGCRKHDTGSDDCGAWSIYTYQPRPGKRRRAPPQAALPIKCSEGSPVKSVPAGQQCPAAPAPAAPVKCAAGSVTDTVPAGQQCARADECRGAQHHPERIQRARGGHQQFQPARQVHLHRHESRRGWAARGR